MKKRNKSQPLSFRFLFNIFLAGIVLLGLFMIVNKTVRFIKSSEKFKIKEIVYDSSVSFLKSSRLAALKGKNIFALGGIDEDKIEICRELGFVGVAILGAIWQRENPIDKFNRIKEKCLKKDLVF